MQTPAPPVQDHRFAVLDGMRGVAAIFVLFCHTMGRKLVAVFPGSYLAVDLFFVLSGFVIAYSYKQKLRVGMKVTEFMRWRLLRLYPLYFLATMVSAGVILLSTFGGEEYHPLLLSVSLLTALFFLPTPPPFSVEPEKLYGLNYPAWSLFYELLANLAFALLVPRITWRVLIGIVGVGFVMLVVTAKMLGTLDAGALFDVRHMFGGLARVTFSFFMGVLLFRLWREERLKWLTAPALIPLLLIPIIFSLQLEGRVGILADLATIVFVFPVLVVLGANARISGWFAKLCVLLGAASYAFYVLQVPIINATDYLSRALLKTPFAAYGPAGTLGLLLLLFGLSLAAHSYYDTHVRGWIANRMRRQTQLRPTLT